MTGENKLEHSKRQVSCGANGNTDTICAPKAHEVWENGTWHEIIWNPSYPTYAAFNTLDIYLYYVENYQRQLAKDWLNVSTSKGVQAVLVDDSWFPAPTLTPKDYSALLYIVGSGVNPDAEMDNRYSAYPSPVSISVTQNVQPSSASSNSQQQEQQSSSNGLQPWIIAVIVIAIVAVIAACIALIWAYRYVRRRKLVFDEKGQLDSNKYPLEKPLSPIGNHGLTAAPPRPIPAVSCGNLSIRSSNINPPLTSTDALMIADTFRQRMRQPEWQNMTDQSKKKAEREVEDEDDELRRRQLSEELLKKELAAEGTLMKKVGKRAHLFTTFADASSDDQSSTLTAVHRFNT